MVLFAFFAVGLWEALIGSLGWQHAPLPDAAFTVALAAAFRSRREGDLLLALGAGLAAGLFGVGPWGLKALMCLSVCMVAGIWRGAERRVRGLDALVRSLVILGGLAILESLVITVTRGTAGLGDGPALFGRALATALVVGAAVAVEGRPQATSSTPSVRRTWRA